MVKLNAGNVLLKPSHRRQLMAWLKRAQRMGGRLGDFICTITLERTGGQTVVHAAVHDAAGDFTCRVRRPDWREAFRELVHMLANRLSAQRLSMFSA
jgi:hypothetical protein